MPLYRFRAVDSAGNLVHGERESADKKSLARRLRDEGFLPLGLDEAPAPSTRRTWWPFRTRRRFTADGLANFTRQMATLVSADLPLDEALETIAADPAGGGVADIARRLQTRLRAGVSLADSMDDTAAAFPPDYIALVRAGEASGRLGPVFSALAETLVAARALEREIRGALIYPTLVIIVTLVVVAILLIAVIPEFEPLFADAGDALPPAARAVLAASEATRSFGVQGLIALMLLALLAGRLARTGPVRKYVDRVILRLPLVGPLVSTADATRFCRALGLLLGNRVEMAVALGLASSAARNARLSSALAGSVERVRRGENVAESLAETESLPPVALQLIRAGEASGRLPEMLEAVSDILSSDLNRRTRTAVSLIAPVVTILLGMLVAGIIGAVLSAIMSVYNLPI